MRMTEKVKEQTIEQLAITFRKYNDPEPSDLPVVEAILNAYEKLIGPIIRPVIGTYITKFLCLKHSATVKVGRNNKAIRIDFNTYKKLLENMISEGAVCYTSNLNNRLMCIIPEQPFETEGIIATKHYDSVIMFKKDTPITNDLFNLFEQYTTERDKYRNRREAHRFVRENIIKGSNSIRQAQELYPNIIQFMPSGVVREYKNTKRRRLKPNQQRIEYINKMLQEKGLNYTFEECVAEFNRCLMLERMNARGDR